MTWRGGCKLVVLAAIVLGGGACNNLRELPANSCGNGVVDPDEDCDGLPVDLCGKPGEANQCRRQCTQGDPSRACPADAAWDCGSDGLCRMASGNFEPGGRVVAAGPVDEIAASDFDGDGRDDLLTAGYDAIEAHFFGEVDGNEQTFVVLGGGQQTPDLPVTGRLSSDSLADVALLRDDGLFVGRGRFDRTISPTLYSPRRIDADRARALFMDARPARSDDVTPINAADELVLFVETAAGTTEVQCPLGGASGPVMEFSGNLLDRISVAAARFSGVLTRPCDYLVWARTGESVVRLIPMCAQLGGSTEWTWNDQSAGYQFAAPATSIELAAGTIGERFVGGIPDAVRVVDVDGDGALDVMAYGSQASDCAQGTTTQLYVSFGSFSDGFRDATGTANAASPFCFDTGAAPPTGLPLAVGRLNADGYPDFVFGGQVLLSEAPPIAGDPPTYRTESFDAQWDVAHVADVNRDGLMDVVAAVRGSPEIFFLQGAGDGALNEFRVGLIGPLGALSVGDFDGDRLLDIAVVEKGLSDSTEGADGSVLPDDSLSVLFGTAFGAPAPPASMGLLPDIEWVAAGNVRFDWHSEQVADLAVASRAAVDAPLSFALLAGSGDRRLFSPFSFVRSSEQSADRLLAATAGKFRGSATGQLDLAVLTGANDQWPCAQPPTAADPPNHFLWLVPLRDEAAIDATELPALPLAPLANGAAVQWSYAVMGRLDLGDDGLDELVVLAPTGDSCVFASGVMATFEASTGQEAWTAAQLQPVQSLPYAPAYLRGRAAPPRDETPEPTTPQGSDPTTGTDGAGTPSDSLVHSHVQVADVDGDGDDDLAVLAFETAEGGFAPATGRPVVLVFLNDRSGALDAAHPIVLRGLDEPGLTGFTFLNVDTDRAKEIAVATTDAVFLADVDLATGAFSNARVMHLRDGATSGASAIASGDFNGDGVPDLAVARRRRADVELYLAAPVRP